ncbi:MAG: gephyrin-like molybdotransferase Glp [Bacillota bacterium]
MKLLKVDTVEQVKEKLKRHFSCHSPGTESIRLDKVLGRIAARDIFSGFDIPEFNRSTVDGYAVLSKDTIGASESLPLFLDIAGSVEMGKATQIILNSGKAAYVPTGGIIPAGADGVVMIEYIEMLDEKTIAVHDSIAPGDNIINIGDDIRKNEILINRGCVIKPQQIGVLAAAGVEYVEVYKKLKIAILSTGDEIVSPFSEVAPGQVRDINAYVLAAMAEELGAEVTSINMLKDDLELLTATIGDLAKHNDIVVVSGGSSAGNKDVTAKAIDNLGNPGVFVHGIAVKPGKPTIIGKSGNTAIIGLPGHPVSAAVIFRVFVGYLVKLILGKEAERLYIQARCTANIHSSPGKETYQMVELSEGPEGYEAYPVYAKSAAISLLSKAQGYITIPMNKEGIKKGEAVRVELL